MNERTVLSIYLDANILIHLVEGYPAREAAMEVLFTIREQERANFVTSELSLAEVLVRPLRLNRTALVERYKQLLAAGGELDVVAISSAVLEASATVRARQGGSLPDAIHVATAVTAGCSLFLSEDARIRVESPLQLVGLSEFAGRFAP